ncbi:hypothetical protein ACC712_38335, partial [Rhizobium ruizarguesonis]
NNGSHILTSALEGKYTLTDVEFARFADGVYYFAKGKFTPDASNSAPTNIHLSKTSLLESTTSVQSPACKCPSKSIRASIS